MDDKQIILNSLNNINLQKNQDKFKQRTQKDANYYNYNFDNAYADNSSPQTKKDTFNT